MPTTRSAWQIHPAGDDLAACLISFDPANYKFNDVPRSIFLSRENVKALNVGPGDDVFVVGRFTNHEGRQMNLPTARFGNIGQMPWEPIKQEDGFEQESFLVEARSIGGYSGSPVFWHILPFAAGMGRRNIEYHAGPFLLGVDWGHLNDWEPVRNEHERPVNPNPKRMQVRMNTGMMAVVPAWKLAELLDTGPLAEHRAKIEQEVKDMRNPSPATSDG